MSTHKAKQYKPHGATLQSWLKGGAKRRSFIIGVVTLLSLLIVSVALAFGVGNVDGVWQFVEDGADGSASCDTWASITGDPFPRSLTSPTIQSSGGFLTDENQVRYGRPSGYDNCPTSQTGFLAQSGFGFNGVNGVLGISPDVPFYLGSFTHYNWPISGQNLNRLEWVDLTLSVPIDCDDNGSSDTTFTFYPRFFLDETDNGADPCPYMDGDPVNANGCADAVDIVQPATTTFTCPDGDYTVNIFGFTSNSDCSTVFDQNAVSTEYVTMEQAQNNACLWAEIDAPDADVAVDKYCAGFTHQQAPVYAIRVTNLGPGTALGNQIVDTLPSGVTYAGFTSQRTVNNVTTSQGSCSAVGQVVTCDLNAALPETTNDPSALWKVDISVTYSGVANPSFINSVTVTTTSGDPVLTNNMDSVNCEPTAVDLSSFGAAPELDSILLTWETASDLNTLGFNIYRAEALDGERTKLNAELIPAAAGGLFGQVYTFRDSSATAGVQVLLLA